MLRSSSCEDLKHAPGQSSPTYALQYASSRKRGLHKLKPILKNLKKKKKNGSQNISSKRFDQAIQKTSSMLLGNLHLHEPYNHASAWKARNTKIEANS